MQQKLFVELLLSRTLVVLTFQALFSCVINEVHPFPLAFPLLPKSLVQDD